MSLLKTGASALGKLLAVVVLATAFVFGMGGVVYLSLRGEEVKVPEIVGKDVSESEKELAARGLRLKKRSYRYSEEKPNTVLQQTPGAGATVKTGLEILVDIAQANPEGSEAPAIIKKSDEVENVDTGDNQKPKAANKNTSKKPEKTRDVISNKANKNSNTANSNSGGADSKTNSNNGGGSTNKNSSTPGGANKPAPANPSKSPATTKPTTAKPAADGGDTRNRRAPQN